MTILLSLGNGKVRFDLKRPDLQRDYDPITIPLLSRTIPFDLKRPDLQRDYD